MSYRPHSLVLAIYLSTRGLAFVLFESPLSPVDWGVKEVRGSQKNDACLSTVGSLLQRYSPGIVILQDTSPEGTRRCWRIRQLNAAVAEMVDTKGLQTISFSRREVMGAFADKAGANKHFLAQTIAKHIPAFERYLPPQRKPWMSEDSRMSLFDAAALALTFFQSPCAGGEKKV